MIAPIDVQRVEAVVDRNVTLVCFAEFSCFIHFDDGSHWRIEAPAEVRQGDDMWPLFPHVQGSSLAILGKRARSVDWTESSLEVEFDFDLCLKIDLDGPYESLLIEDTKTHETAVTSKPQR